MVLTVINLALCVIVVGLGYLAHKKHKDMLSAFTAVGFALFGISHAVTLIGLGGKFVNFLIIIRILAYLLIAFALFMTISEKNS
ncbi:MAG: hypothetical protein ISS92_03675 [Candidatus Omnitrophica bacterium]|nr:hypothetical protein [Candidatus Omnitrophota bacterium]